MKVTLDPYDLIGCADPLGAQDSHVLKVIGALDGFTVTIQGNSMTLTAGTWASAIGWSPPAADRSSSLPAAPSGRAGGTGAGSSGRSPAG